MCDPHSSAPAPNAASNDLEYPTEKIRQMSYLHDCRQESMIDFLNIIYSTLIQIQHTD